MLYLFQVSFVKTLVEHILAKYFFINFTYQVGISILTVCAGVGSHKTPENWGLIGIQLYLKNTSKTWTFRAKALHREVSIALVRTRAVARRTKQGRCECKICRQKNFSGENYF